MASSKLSELTALTSAGDDDLLYISDTADSGSSYASKKITKANFLSGFATQSYVTTQITNLIDGAPDALNTLNELAAALNDDASAASSLTTLINANETHIDNMATLTGVAKDSTSLGAFSGTTIADGQTVKAALQALETSVESKGSAASLTSVTTTANNAYTLAGVTQDDTDLGTFSGSTIADNDSIKDALQALETAVESITVSDVTDLTASASEINVLDGVTATTAELNYVDGVTSNIQTQLDAKTADGDNVNNLVASTSADSEPTNWHFLVVDTSNGAIKVLDKTFIEVEG